MYTKGDAIPSFWRRQRKCPPRKDDLHPHPHPSSVTVMTESLLPLSLSQNTSAHTSQTSSRMFSLMTDWSSLAQCSGNKLKASEYKGSACSWSLQYLQQAVIVKLSSCEDSRAPVTGTLSTENLSLATTAAATRRPSQTKLFNVGCYICKYLIVEFISFVLSHPFISQLNIHSLDVSSGCILGRVNLLACMSHIPGLQGWCILSWVVSKVMHHHHDSILVTLSGRTIFQHGQMAGFQKRSDISTEAFIMFFFTDWCPAWCCPSRRYAVWPCHHLYLCARTLCWYVRWLAGFCLPT